MNDEYEFIHRACPVCGKQGYLKLLVPPSFTMFAVNDDECVSPIRDVEGKETGNGFEVWRHEESVI